MVKGAKLLDLPTASRPWPFLEKVHRTRVACDVAPDVRSRLADDQSTSSERPEEDLK